MAIALLVGSPGDVTGLLGLCSCRIGGLASRKTRLIAAIVPSVASTIFVETIEGLNAELASAGYQLLLGLSGYDASRELELTRAMLTGAGLPIVEIWDSTPSPLDTAVGFSHYAVGALVAEHLLVQGL